MHWAFWVLGLGTAAAAAGVCLWALFADRARGRRRCPRCWYDLSGVAMPAVCPECGQRVASERQLRRTRRRWRLALAAAAVAIAAGWLAPACATGRWVRAVPAPMLDVVIGIWFQKEAQQRLASRSSDHPWDRALLSWAIAHGIRTANDTMCELNIRSARWSVAESGDPHGWIAAEVFRAATTRDTQSTRVTALTYFPASRGSALRRYAASAEVTGHEAILLARQVVAPGHGAYVVDHEGRLAWMRSALMEHRLSPSVREAVLRRMTQFTEEHLLIIEKWLRRERSPEAREQGLEILGEAAMAAQPEATNRILCRLAADHSDPTTRTRAQRLLDGQ